MAWTAYRIVFRVRTPLHIGYARMGNVHYTRPYVTGRAIWGALTERVTRDLAARTNQPAVNFEAYKSQSDTICNRLAYTYFYLAEKRDDGDFAIVWPWEEQKVAPYLKSYVSTALEGLSGSALKGSLHETEMIAPQRSAESGPTYLMGYFFERTQDDPSLAQGALAWQTALNRLHFGAERNYGWGWVDVALADKEGFRKGALFGGAADFDGNGEQPRVTVAKGGCLLAHTKPLGVAAEGEVEPLVGREIGIDSFHYAGQHVNYLGMCFAPGSVLTQEKTLTIKQFGVWAAAA